MEALYSKTAQGAGVLGDVAGLGVLLATAHQRSCQHGRSLSGGHWSREAKPVSPAVSLQSPPPPKLVKEKLFKGPRSIFTEQSEKGEPGAERR